MSGDFIAAITISKNPNLTWKKIEKYFNTLKFLFLQPTGAFILENVIVQYEMNSEVPFSFSLYFNNEAEKKHLFSGRTEENIKKWVEALKEASYEYWRSRLILLQEKLRFITGLVNFINSIYKLVL